ncbi:MAG: CPBP family intramembrane glutamic endopeptidase [Oscillospiraceae bacterium]|nr:CPBP family intramembrane glutamic endopeptidase [Oscillospiraceae bacterium]
MKKNELQSDNELYGCALRICAGLLLFMLLDAGLSLLAMRAASQGTALYAGQAAAYAAAMCAAVCCARTGRAGQTPALGTGGRFDFFSLFAVFCAVSFGASVCGGVVRGLLQAAGLGAAASPALPVGAGAWVFFLLKSVLLPALLEELLFRGAILDRLLPFGERFAVLVSAVLFALSHSAAEALPGALLFGIFFALLRLRTGSLLPGMLFHLLNNAGAVGALLLTEKAPFLYDGIYTATGIVGALCALGTLVYYLRAGRAPLPPAREPRAGAFFRTLPTLLWLAVSVLVIAVNAGV